jgi:tetratricopeptide (TPR) repeat protein
MGIAVSLEMSGGGGAVAQTQTDRSGKFEFLQLSPALYEVHIRAAGFRPDAQSVDLTAFHSGTANFVLNADSGAPGSSAVPPEGPGATVSALDANVPESARNEVASAEQLLAQGKNFDKSIQLLKKAVKQYPQYGKAYLLLGVAYSSQKNWDDAEKALQKSIQVDPGNAAAYVALGSVENEKKNYPEAEKYLTKAVELSPDSADAQFELGRAYWGLGRWDDAQQHVAKANQIQPNSSAQHLLMGNIMLRERNAEAALSEFKKSLELDPKGPMAEPTRQIIGRIEAALKQQAAAPK